MRIQIATGNTMNQLDFITVRDSVNGCRYSNIRPVVNCPKGVINCLPSGWITKKK